MRKRPISIGAEGVSHKFAIYGESLRQKDRIWTVLWKAYGTEGAILEKEESLRFRTE
ncbi:hypothetical protein DW1_1419 [Proteiniborus sp. DW1]|nr:hypothetical protein DW1_1419 [Proteiniborus sp. DW1]